MPKRAMESLTEPMFYVLLAFTVRPLCGIEAAEFIKTWTKGRVQVGPATLYTILGKFEKEGYLKETAVAGRKRTYAITDKGRRAYLQELDRLQACLNDARRLPPPTVPAGEEGPLSPAPSPA
ncbi:MAG TPA: PadR family transcriptional regulator [Candidatus Evtepia faecigallinarum]|nr:PadR family transcriptional regulator [Candidatus Evtepia faecigallinarum]